MNRSCSFSISRALGAMVLLIAWFAVSNHCVLMVISGQHLAAATGMEKNCCSPQGKGGGDQREVPSRVCCKSLRVLPTDAVTTVLPKPDAADLAQVVWSAVVEIRLDEGSVPRLPQATGPPGVRSFAEVVLQRSLLAHAPPLAV